MVSGLFSKLIGTGKAKVAPSVTIHLADEDWVPLRQKYRAASDDLVLETLNKMEALLERMVYELDKPATVNTHQGTLSR